MCGIAGIFSATGRADHFETDLSEMTKAIAHRGPDDNGCFSDDYVELGFRRLSIIDLQNGNQPLFNENKSLVLVCNGEIFNYKELRAELRAKGHLFSTNCDVEVILHLYEEHGPDLIKKLNGQFAFALYDAKQRSVLLARDHFGIAPLFYTTVNDSLVFGSEIKSLLKHSKVSRSVNLTALDQIFTFPGMVSPSTMFRDIFSLKPGHYLYCSPEKFETREYWDLIYPTHAPVTGKSEAYYVEELCSALLQSVSYRLNADVPVGLNVSGGLDSALVACLARAISPRTDFHSFSIQFGDASIDESKYQLQVARLIQSTHHACLFTNEDILERLKAAVYHAECPLKETYNTCSLALSALARQHNVKVVLGGEGADELFGGYVGYKFDSMQLPSHRYPLYDDFRDLELREKLWGDEHFIYDKKITELEDAKLGIYSNRLNQLYPEFSSIAEGVIDKSKIENRHVFHKRSYLDFKLRLSDHLLADHGDRVGYANSVEMRYPFLDVNVVRCVRNIPVSILAQAMNEKHLLKKCAAGYVPAAILEREKFSFVAPGSNYIIKQNNQWINDLLSYDLIRRQGYFNPDVVELLKKRYLKDGFSINQTFENDLLMIVLTFGIFLECFDVPDFG